MRNKKLSTKTTVTIATLALIVAGTGTLGLTMTNAGQKTVESEIKNEEIESLYSEENDSTAKIAVEHSKDVTDSSQADSDDDEKHNLVVEVPYSVVVEGDIEYEVSNDGTLPTEGREKVDESDYSESKNKGKREVKDALNHEKETTDEAVEEETDRLR